MEVNLGEITRLKQRLQNLYIRVESLMLKPEGIKPLERFLPEVMKQDYVQGSVQKKKRSLQMRKENKGN